MTEKISIGFSPYSTRKATSSLLRNLDVPRFPFPNAWWKKLDLASETTCSSTSKSMSLQTVKSSKHSTSASQSLSKVKRIAWHPDRSLLDPTVLRLENLAVLHLVLDRTDSCHCRTVISYKKQVEINLASKLYVNPNASYS